MRSDFQQRVLAALRRVGNVVGFGAWAAFLTAASAQFALDSTFVYYPRAPVQELGRTVPYAVKGVVVYITSQEHCWNEIAHTTIIASGVLMLAWFVAVQLGVLPRVPRWGSDG